VLDIADVCLRADREDGFDHSFAAGEIAVVLGSNHAGKTDLCRLIAGLHTRARGEIRLDHFVLGGLKPQRRPVSLVYQAFVNYPNLTVAENIASPMRARRMSYPARRSEVNKLAAMLQISDLMERFPHELSGGQQQRLAIARALAKNARILLLDEPLVNLDFKLREALEYELRDLLRSTNTVVIYTSSDPRDAFALGDQVLLLENGRKVQAGTPLEVYRRPASFVAMELLAEPSVNRFTQAGKNCALRPEHVGVGEAIDAATMIGFDMTVTAYETNGDDSFIHGRVADSDWVVRCYGMRDVRVGSGLKLHARPADVVSF
jgi:glycerol transport system ATP-binding protein